MRSIAHQIDDQKALLISVPVIAILFPNITGLIVNSRYTASLLFFQYCYFILLVFILWKGNIYTIVFLKTKVDADKKNYWQYLLLILFATLIYAAITAGAMIKLWTLLSEKNEIKWPAFFYSVLILILVSIFITIIYENYFFYKKKLSALSKMERLNHAKAQAELSILKSQIDPHFLYNSFNTLSFLISSNPENAKLYNDTLAKIYRYILVNKEKDLIVLREEIEFISNYFYLLSIRFGDAIKMTIEISNSEAEGLLIPPLSLQTLVENAIKHNSFADENPLTVSVSILQNQVIVTNRINKKNTSEHNSRTGLANLENRYKLITNKNISITSTQFFTVKLPVVSIK